MANKTLQSEIQKKRNKYDANQVQRDINQNQRLSHVIDIIAQEEQYKDLFDSKGKFTKEEVIEAAKFALQAQPYDISVRHLDVDDSPVYYKDHQSDKRTARGRFKRKDLDDMGKALIKKAKEMQDQIEEEEIDAFLSKSETMDVGEEINENDASELAEQRNVDEYETSKVVDKIITYTHYTEHMDKFFAGELLIEEESGSDINKQTKRKTTPEANKKAVDYYMSIIDSALNKQVPSLREFKDMLDRRIKRTLEGERNVFKRYHADDKNDVKIIQGLKPVKAKLVSQADQLLVKYQGMYEAVKKGEMAPEVLKLFLNSALMNTQTAGEHDLYELLMEPIDKGDNPSKAEVEEYKNTLANCAINTHFNKPNKAIGMQVNDGICISPANWVLLAKRKNIIPKGEKITGDDAVKASFKYMESFIHFKSGPNEDVNRRIYINCKPKKQKMMVEAWWQALDAYPELAKTMYFKIGGNTNYDRQEKIVLYLPKNKDMKDIMPFLKTFSEKCKKYDKEHKLVDNALADERETQITAKMILPGIGFAIEPKVSILQDKIRDNWYDEKEFNEMYKLTHSPNAQVKNDFSYSYNMYVNKALILSACIAKKKLNLAKDAKVNDHKEKLAPLMKRYFADFMKLAGADPKSLEISEDAKQDDLKD